MHSIQCISCVLLHNTFHLCVARADRCELRLAAAGDRLEILSVRLIFFYFTLPLAMRDYNHYLFDSTYYSKLIPVMSMII